MDILLVAFQLRRPGDTKDADVLLAVRQDFLTLLPARTDDFVLLGALWDEGLAQEVVDVFGALQVCQRHKRLGEYKKKEREKFHYIDSVRRRGCEPCSENIVGGGLTGSDSLWKCLWF